MFANTWKKKFKKSSLFRVTFPAFLELTTENKNKNYLKLNP